MVVKASHTGLRDWLVQRISAVVIGLYMLFILVLYVGKSAALFCPMAAFIR